MKTVFIPRWTGSKCVYICSITIHDADRNTGIVNQPLCKNGLSPKVIFEEENMPLSYQSSVLVIVTKLNFSTFIALKS